MEVEKNMYKKNKAITLIALIITIIILLILAGVTISIIIGNGGLLEKATQSGEIYKEQSAKEKLEIVLGDLQADKYVEKDYNKNEYIDNKLEKENMVVVDNIVIVDDWKFEIDRNVPKIVTGLGKGEQNDTIQIEANAQIREDYVNANLQVNITYEGTISQIKIKGEDMEIPTKVENIYELEKEITQNGIYTIYVKDEEGNYKIGKIEVTDITEDIEIWNKQDMEAFRDKVNSGRTFEGKTARVMADIDLNEGKYIISEDGKITFNSDATQWEPISKYEANKTKYFKGTFEGNHHIINGLYINNTLDRQGLFAQTETIAIIKDIVIENGFIKARNYTATIASENYGRIEGCINKIEVKGNSYVAGITGVNKGDIINCCNERDITGDKDTIGGIVGQLAGTIDGAANFGTIKALSGNQAGDSVLGGIAGQMGYSKNSKISNSYNVGIVNGAKAEVGGIYGNTFSNSYYTKQITNCYNIGTISGSSKVGSIGGRTRYTTFTNCYWTTSQACTAFADDTPTYVKTAKKTAEELKTMSATLGEAYTDDVQNEDGTWRYNNGYPILKWQINE